MPALKVVLAEDNLLVRRGLKEVLAGEGIDVVATCGDLESLLTAVAGAPPDVVVTDIRMPPTQTDEGIRAATHFRTTRPQLGVLVLSQYMEASYALALLEHGSRGRGYLLKDHVGDASRLMTAIRSVATGGSYIDDLVVDALVAARRSDGPSLLSRLTDREAEILAAVACGRSNAGIAAELGISVRAVEKHVSSIFTKLDLAEDGASHRRVKAALVALRHGGS